MLNKTEPFLFLLYFLFFYSTTLKCQVFLLTNKKVRKELRVREALISQSTGVLSAQFYTQTPHTPPICPHWGVMTHTWPSFM